MSIFLVFQIIDIRLDLQHPTSVVVFSFEYPVELKINNQPKKKIKKDTDSVIITPTNTIAKAKKEVEVRKKAAALS